MRISDWSSDVCSSDLRVRLDTMECDKITQLPNVQGFHGIFPDKRDPLDSAINHTTRVFCGNEFHIPQPNAGRDLDDPSTYYCLFSCVDAAPMQVRWKRSEEPRVGKEGVSTCGSRWWRNV